MNNQLFLILIIILVLLMIHRSSNNMPVSTPTIPTIPTTVPVNLPQLDSLFQNVLSNSIPQQQQMRY